MPTMRQLRRAVLTAFFLFHLTAVAAVAQKDFRFMQSPVKDQGQRGTCTAFALVATLETFPGVPSRLSEQYLYAFMKKGQLDMWADPLWRSLLQDVEHQSLAVTEGETLSKYVLLFQIFGIPHEEFLPYRGDAPPKFGPDMPPVFQYLFEAQVTSEKLAAVGKYGKYGLAPTARVEALAGEKARDVEAIKRWIDASGAVAIPVHYKIHSPTWSKYGPRASDGSIHELTPGEMVDVTDDKTKWTWEEARRKFPGLIENLRSRNLHAIYRFPKGEYEGHAVTIVGYTNDAFIIKNSWGPSWGEHGYGYVSFEYHRLFAREALLIGQVQYRGPKPRPFVFSVLGLTQFRLKAQPIISNGQRSLILSTYTMEPQDPYLDRVDYEVYWRGQRIPCPALHQEGDTAFRCEVPLGPSFSPADPLAVDVRYTAIASGSSAEGISPQQDSFTEHYKNVTWATQDYKSVGRTSP
jgi:hypothetical protein